jgi:hypothetical protein
MDLAEEVLLDPKLVNSFFNGWKKSYSCATCAV